MRRVKWRRFIVCYSDKTESVAKSSSSFGWGNGGNVTSAGWQVTLACAFPLRCSDFTCNFTYFTLPAYNILQHAHITEFQSYQQTGRRWVHRLQSADETAVQWLNTYLAWRIGYNNNCWNSHNNGFTGKIQTRLHQFFTMSRITTAKKCCEMRHQITDIRSVMRMTELHTPGLQQTLLY